jgi:NDP-sugar pyrophosphorylase family protein
MCTLDATFFDYQPVPKAVGSDELGLPQTLAVIAKDRAVNVVKATGWMQISSPEDLIRAEQFVK